MGSCNKVPRTDSNEEIKNNQLNRQGNPPGNPRASSINAGGNSNQANQANRLPPAPTNHFQYPPSYSSTNIYQGNNAGYPNHNSSSYQQSNNAGRANNYYSASPYSQSIPISSGRNDTGPVIAETKAVTRFSRIIDDKILIVDSSDHSHWVNFKYKSIYPAKAIIHYFAREGFDKLKGRHYFFANPQTLPKTQEFDLDAGNEVSFERRYKSSFNNINEAMLEVRDKLTYPLVIELECRNPSNMREEQVLISCFKIIKEGNTFTAAVLKQSIRIDGTYRIITNFYGTSASGDESECLICLTEVKTVAVLPCRHVCYCDGCMSEIAKKSKNDCPVCRQAISSYLKVNH